MVGIWEINQLINYLTISGTGHIEARSEIGKLKMEIGKQGLLI